MVSCVLTHLGREEEKEREGEGERREGRERERGERLLRVAICCISATYSSQQNKSSHCTPHQSPVLQDSICCLETQTKGNPLQSEHSLLRLLVTPPSIYGRDGV